MRRVVSLLLPAIAGLPLFAASPWPLWETYARRFLAPQGRILDVDARNRTTSEGQAYAMFFALVANDRVRFEQLLGWTENNLAQGDLAARLAAWEWSESAPGVWSVRDTNSAADADVWLAYTLLEAGRLWGEPRFTRLGRLHADLIARREIASIPGFGAMLLPGFRDFRIRDEVFYLNASYVPVQVLLGLAAHRPGGPWRDVAANVPRLVKASAPGGFALDWVSYRPGQGIVFEGPSGKRAVAGYDAIRVYLWAGMLSPALRARTGLLEDLSGMSRALLRRNTPPAIVHVDGRVEDENGSVGFSAALLPYLVARGEQRLVAQQKARVKAAWNPATGLYGTDGRYYDQNLVLFSNGWLEGRYRFELEGGLKLNWEETK